MANKVAESGMMFNGTISFVYDGSQCLLDAAQDGVYLTTAFGRRCLNDILAEQCQELQDIIMNAQENSNAET